LAAFKHWKPVDYAADLIFPHRVGNQPNPCRTPGKSRKVLPPIGLRSLSAQSAFWQYREHRQNRKKTSRRQNR